MSSASIPGNDGMSITREELIRVLRAGRTVLLDVLSPESFAALHIPGAINLPVAEIPRRAP
ncbi:MAG TPA: rhodanese-like domain-containing protein, partial [Vicinamibacterales bacterium]|nr:rhodanese-like domain-containing protein [Vicinamibacterales bacterium]